ncbi:MAG: hypothetical protein K0S27_73 [Gammaproteobacteria bacterium]|jgi:prepilin-type N-terminal cleavage/methylation domain-containing protein|nr:hypothetical protein [Gammaproteobacteria bacterium]
MHQRNIQGFTFIEILISLTLLSFILLGFDGMEIYSLRSMRAAYYLHVAKNQLAAMIERLQAVAPYQDIDEGVATWNLQNKQLLPAGEGTVFGHFPSYRLMLYWGDGAHNKCNSLPSLQASCIEQAIQL